MKLIGPGIGIAIVIALAATFLVASRGVDRTEQNVQDADKPGRLAATSLSFTPPLPAEAVLAVDGDGLAENEPLYAFTRRRVSTDVRAVRRSGPDTLQSAPCSARWTSRRVRTA